MRSSVAASVRARSAARSAALAAAVDLRAIAGARARAVFALEDRAAGGGAQFAELLVQAGAVAGDVVAGRAAQAGERAGALEHRAAALALEPRGGGGERATGGRAIDGHGGLRGVGGRRAGDRGDVVEQRAVRVVADAGDHRHPQQRDRPAQGLVAEREQVRERPAAAGDDDHLDLLARREVVERAADRGRGVAVLDGRERPHEGPGPPAALQARQHVVTGLAGLAR